MKRWIISVHGKYEKALLMTASLGLEMSGPIVITFCLVLFLLVLNDGAFAGTNLSNAADGVKGEVNSVSSKVVGTAATAGFALMGAGAGNTGRMIAATGVAGTVGYMAWPMIQQTLSNITGTR